MKVICKSFPKFKNDMIVTKDPNLTIGKSYDVIEISHYIHNKYGILTLKMFTIIGDQGTHCHYWSDYFYSQEEIRKLKLEKIKKAVE